jgi:peptidoglycan/xylan/chitin deacetylase (PgdA/CDA1 family)
MLTDREKSFIQLQLALFSGYNINKDLPPNYADLLLGRIEASVTSFDQFGNHDLPPSPFSRSGFFLKPVINQWLQERINEDSIDPRNSPAEPLWPEGKKFTVCLTHDVDTVTLCLPAYWRMFKRFFRPLPKNRSEIMLNLEMSLKLAAASVAYCLPRRPQYCYFEPLLSIEKQYGFRSTFFFFPNMASRYHYLDFENYNYNDRVNFQGQMITIAELRREIDRRGWEIGLHGTYFSFDDAEELKRQKEQLEYALQKEILSIRQHILHFNITKTPRAQSQAGFKYDSTFGSNRMIGFRNGLAFPFYHYDLRDDSPLPLLQLPLHIQDFALLSPLGLGLSPRLALVRAQEMIDKVEATGGLITLLWHPDKIDLRRFPGWLWVYEELLRYIAQKEAWVAPIREIGDWWENRRDKIKVCCPEKRA